MSNVEKILIRLIFMMLDTMHSAMVRFTARWNVIFDGMSGATVVEIAADDGGIRMAV